MADSFWCASLFWKGKGGYGVKSFLVSLLGSWATQARLKRSTCFLYPFLQKTLPRENYVSKESSLHFQSWNFSYLKCPAPRLSPKRFDLKSGKGSNFCVGWCGKEKAPRERGAISESSVATVTIQLVRFQGPWISLRCTFFVLQTSYLFWVLKLELETWLEFRN